jgi:hypothetical protein
MSLIPYFDLEDVKAPVVAIRVSEADEHGRLLGHLITQREPYRGEYAQPGDVATQYGKLYVYSAPVILPSQECQPWEADPHANKPIGRTTPPVPPMLSLKPGDLLVAHHIKGLPDPLNEQEGHPAVKLVGATVIAHDVDEAAACTALGQYLGHDSENYRKAIHSWLAAPECLMRDVAEELARKEPNEALVAIWKVERGNNQCYTLGTTGIWFFHTPNAEEAGVDISGDPGIFLFTNGQPWGGQYWTDCGYEYDSGIEGDLIPATLEDLEKMGYDVESLRTEMVAVLEDQLPSGADPFDFLAAQGADLPDWALDNAPQRRR